MVHFCWSYGEQKKEHRGCIDLQWLKDNSYSAVRLRDLQKHCQPLPKAIVSLCVYFAIDIAVTNFITFTEFSTRIEVF